MAAGALEQVWHDRWFARVREAFSARGWSPEWEDAAGSSHTVTFLTPDELHAIRKEISAAITRRMDERRTDPAKRPAGALPVEIVTFACPRLDLATLADEDAAAHADGSEDPGDEDAGDIDSATSIRRPGRIRRTRRVVNELYLEMIRKTRYILIIGTTSTTQGGRP